MRISKGLLKEILVHAGADYPSECCGLLVGQDDQVRAVEPTHNLYADERGDRFEIDPLDHVRIWEAARAAGEEIIGCYHSHPDGFARPSSLDLRLARRFGGPFGYLVVAIQEDGACQVFSGEITDSGRIVPTPLEIVEPLEEA